jgi:hypothetical protein
MNEPRITQTQGAFPWHGLLTDAQGFSCWNSTVTGIDASA